MTGAALDPSTGAALVTTVGDGAEGSAAEGSAVEGSAIEGSAIEGSAVEGSAPRSGAVVSRRGALLNALAELVTGARLEELEGVQPKRLAAKPSETATVRFEAMAWSMLGSRSEANYGPRKATHR